MSIKKKLIGDTIRITWVHSGITPTSIHTSIINGSGTSINSMTMISSGNGHYYSLFTIPDTPQFYVAETISWVNSYPYKRREMFKAIIGDVS